MEGIVARRVIPSDNGCLFNAVGYVLDHDKNKAPELRQVIAATVVSDPIKYSEAFLGKPNEECCSWILDSEKWGGAIELSILADYYGCEIAAYDIQITRCDLYGQEKKYLERVTLIYDGLHYDALAMSPFDGAPEEFDQTIFLVLSNRTIGPVEGLGLNLVKEQHRQGVICNTKSFSSVGAGNLVVQMTMDLYFLIFIFELWSIDVDKICIVVFNHTTNFFFLGKGALLTLLDSLCVVGYARSGWSDIRRLCSMLK